MNLQSTLQIHGFGTPEGACKAVNTRGDKAARACGGATDDGPASTIQISNWLDDKGFPSSMNKQVAEKLSALGMSPKLIKFPFTIEKNPYNMLKIPGATGLYNPETKTLGISTEKTNVDDVVHELTHWAMFSQMPGIIKPRDFQPNSDLSTLQDSPGLREDTMAMMNEYKKSRDNGERWVRESKGSDTPINTYDFVNMSDNGVKYARAPSGYAMTNPAEWVAVSAENVVNGKRVGPASEKLVKNLWSGKYIQ